MLSRVPRSLALASACFFAAAYFAVRFPHTPGNVAVSYAATFLTALPALAALVRYLGVRRAALGVLALSALAYAIEMVGVATGFPYGSFHYGDELGPKLLGLVPWLLPVSYTPLVIAAVAASWGSRRTVRVLRSTLLLVLMDGVLDPAAAALGFWVWPEGGAYYGVPPSNYAGWLLSGALAAALLLGVGRWRTVPLPGLLDGAIVAVSFWTGATTFLGLAFPALLGAALIAYLLYKRAQLRAHRPGKATPDAGRV